MNTHRKQKQKNEREEREKREESDLWTIMTDCTVKQYASGGVRPLSMEEQILQFQISQRLTGMTGKTGVHREKNH